jgi:hypothetical protein
MDNSHFGNEKHVWGVLTTIHPEENLSIVGDFAPQSIRSWRAVFRQWATEYALHLTQPASSLPVTSIVINPPAQGEDCLEVVLLVVGVMRHGEPLDLNDPMTYTLWLDFINDHPARTEHWNWWRTHRDEFRYL